jgi:CubicO group peptidase (beta-lactamase class C family)
MNLASTHSWAQHARRALLVPLWALVVAAAPASGASDWRDNATSAEQAQDAVAFQGMDDAIRDQSPDVQSVVVTLRGRVVYSFYRDGLPDQPRDVQSVAKSALSVLVGMALQQGKIESLDQPIVALMPEWAGLNSDVRTSTITLRHVLTMRAGFAVDDPTGTAAAGTPRDAWARPLRHAPGEAFAYDNALIPMVGVVLEKAFGMPLAELVRVNLVTPLGMQAPVLQRGVHMRTLDMAKLGHLMLDKGAWGGRQLLPEAYALAATQPQSPGGAPAMMPYGYMWWITPQPAPRRTFLASGYGGQTILVNPALELVLAVTATASEASQRRGQSVQLVRTKLFNAAQQRAGANP